MSSGPNPSRPIVVHVFARTDVGRTRDHNEDAFVVADLTTDCAELVAEVRTHEVGELGSLFMVADGMGGAAAGELASEMATAVVLNELREHWRNSARRDGDTFAAAIRAAGEEANARINEYAVKHPENRGMGSTATIAGLLGDTLYLGQVGDSRGYLVRDGKALQITRDQSLVQRLVEAGEITPEEAEQSDRRNIILQALGPEATVKIELTHQQVKRGDVLVLCSDGLSGQVRVDEIGQIVRDERDLVNICQRLIDMANEAGGPDNITVIAVRFEGDGIEAATSSDEVRHRVFETELEPEARVTMEVPAVHDEITNEIAVVPQLEVTAVTPAVVPPAAPRSTVPLSVPSTVPSSESELMTAAGDPLLPTPRGWGLGTLRLVFIGIALVVAAALWLWSPKFGSWK